MKSNISLYGFSGVGRAGKDSAANILCKLLGIVVHRYAFANELKGALDPICKKYHGFSCFTGDAKEKEIIRPLMVSLGESVREINKRAWINRIEEHLNALSKENSNFTCFITDIRYENEADFVQKEWDGILINIERQDGSRCRYLPANDAEEENYPKVKAKADINLVASNLTELESEIINKVLPRIQA